MLVALALAVGARAGVYPGNTVSPACCVARLVDGVWMALVGFSAVGIEGTGSGKPTDDDVAVASSPSSL